MEAWVDEETGSLWHIVAWVDAGETPTLPSYLLRVSSMLRIWLAMMVQAASSVVSISDGAAVSPTEVSFLASSGAALNLAKISVRVFLTMAISSLFIFLERSEREMKLILSSVAVAFLSADAASWREASTNWGSFMMTKAWSGVLVSSR